MPPKPKVSRPRPRRGPVATIRVGAVSIPIYRQQTRTGIAYVVQPSRDQRQSRASLDDARALAQEMARTLSDYGAQALTLTGEQRADYWAAVEAVRPLNLTLSVAAIEYAEARQILGPRHSLVTAARAYRASLAEANDSPLTIAEAVGLFLEAKRSWIVQPQSCDGKKCASFCGTIIAKCHQIDYTHNIPEMNPLRRCAEAISVPLWSFFHAAAVGK